MKRISPPKWLPFLVLPYLVLLIFVGSIITAPPLHHTDPAQEAFGALQIPSAPHAAHLDRFSYVEPRSIIATVTSPVITARVAPDLDALEIATFAETNVHGGAQVFLLTARPGEDPAVETDDGTWYEALLPVRPNGTTGFIPAEAVVLSKTSYRIVVDRSRFELTLWKGSDLVDRMPVGLGTGATPTPVGSFYLTVLLEPDDPAGVYGPFAYGLSGFSEVLIDWAGGGVVGLHGTNDPSSVGIRSSHGCIRLLNEDIESLVPMLPVGTPIEII
ncbi:MAG TPA: L,D-transpeptidase [Actinomycetota bacterium]|nr:L,D-transpeptidase [Actinomycetota bacterium]